MKKSAHTSLLTFIIFTFSFMACQTVAAQGSFREKIKERLKEHREKNAAINNGTITAAGDHDLKININGKRRTYKLHIPNSYKNSVPAPMVLAFHGGGGNSTIMANDDYYGLISKSEKEGFIVVFPNGASILPSGTLATWNAGNCCGYARDNKIDDIGFVRSIITGLEGKLNIDPKKIYAIGMSNGGMFSYRLACEMADTFKAVASVAGTDNCDTCRPSRPISILHIQAKDDDHVLFNGGAGKNAFSDLSKVTDFTSVPETMSRWVYRDNCNKTPKKVLNKNGAYCEAYSGCDNNVQVKLCVTETGGHSWPGAKKTPRKKSEKPSQVISATDEIWDFFKGL